MDEMRVHPQAELCIKAVDEDTIAELNAQWMEKEGPTDVLAFPMDELRPGHGQRGARGGRPRRPGAVPRRSPSARARRPVTAREAEIELLTVHGILHLLGYDHAEPEEHPEMFGLQDRAAGRVARRPGPRLTR